jgi:hypothetical protein
VVYEEYVIRETKKYSRRQTAASFAILSVLVIIGFGILWAQFNHNPAILQKELFLQPTAKQKDFAPEAITDAIIPSPPGLVPFTAPESFDAQNLSDKINGKAELYLSAGFVSLSSQRFMDENDPSLWIEAFVYDMAKGENAFSVFSSQRRDGAATLELTPYAYRTANALFFVHGSFYIEMIASEATDRAFSPMKLLAENFIRTTAVRAVAIQAKNLFPNQGLVSGSIVLIAADAFGFERLNQVYTAEYNFGDYQMMAFLSRRKGRREAQDLALAYQEFLKAFGGNYQDDHLTIKGAKLIEILETYEVIFPCGDYVAGVREADNKQQAIDLAVRLYDRLKAGP